MATYTVYIAFTAGKGSSVSFRYPTTTSTTGTGHTSGNPLELNAGDNVKFVEVSGSGGGGTISGLNIFTDNSNFSYSGGDGIGEIADRTVATGTTPSSVDTITATTGVGGNTDNFYFKRVAPPITAPVISSVTNNNASAANVTATVNLSSNGSGGTLKYAQTTSNSVPASGWQTSASFSHPRGTTRYYWASQDEDTSGTFDDSGAIAVGYLAPDTNVSISNSALTIGPSDTSDSVVVSGTTSGETYVVTIDNGTPSTASYRLGETVATGSSTTINFSGHFPSEGNTYTYDIHAQRPTSTGGDGSSYTKASGVEFTVTRERAAITLGYGILLLDTDGTTSIISPDTRFFVKLTDEQSFSLAAGASDNILLDMTGLTTSNSTVIVLQLLYPTTFVAAPTVTRITSGASEGFQLTNPNSSTITFRAFAARF